MSMARDVPESDRCPIEGCHRKAYLGGKCRPCRTEGRVCICGKTGGLFYGPLCIACWRVADGAKKVCSCGRTSGKFYGLVCSACYQQSSREHLYEFIATWKSKGCVDCGFVGDPCQIDPDHVLEGKTVGIGRLVTVSGKALERIKAELALCVPRCKVCHRQVSRQREQARPQGYVRGPASLSGQKRQLVLDFKASHGWACTDCLTVYNPSDGWDPSVLELDHLPAFEKVEHLSVMMNAGSGQRFTVEDVRLELTKVEVVCANCHPLRTKRRLA